MPRTNGRRVSARQFEILWEFLDSHKDIATGFNRSLQAKEYSKRKWVEVTASLNAQGVDGAVKQPLEWSKYWVDFKSKLKKRVADVNRSQSRTGGGPSTVHPLTEIELKFLNILGVDFGQGMPGVQVDPFPVLPESSPSQENERVLEIPTTPPVEHLGEELLELLIPPPEEFVSPPSGPSASLTHAPPSNRTCSAGLRQRRRRKSTMTQESARRALVESSRVKAEAMVRASAALEGILGVLQRIESQFLTTIAAAPRAE